MALPLLYEIANLIILDHLEKELARTKQENEY